MKNIWIVLVVIMFLASCKKEDCACVIIDTAVDLSVSDNNGADLLDPVNTNSFDENDIKLFYSDGGSLKEYFSGNLDNPKHFMIFPVQGEKYRIRLFPEKPITYIQWKGTDMDTLQCEFKETENSKVCTKVWYNSELMYDTKNGTERFFEVVK